MLATQPIGMPEAICSPFSANPLGQRVFSKGRETLDFALQKGESVTFHYRMLIHNGSVLSPKDIKKFSLVNSKYKSYFNGSDLSHWIVPENNIWWIVDEKTLKIKSGPEKKDQPFGPKINLKISVSDLNLSLALERWIQVFLCVEMMQVILKFKLEFQDH